MPLAIGTIVAGYRIEGILGAGAMGTVYLAAHPTLPRNDALKLLSAELSVDAQFRARFIREADLAATLNHPNIVTVFNRGETDNGQLWIAMEYVEGTAASDLASANLTTARVVRIISDVAKALDYAHTRRILHRDVKPSNFLIASPGVPDQERVLLADFGIARALDDATTLTATGSLVFTAAYAAPEAIQGGPVDHRTDVYSLGCSLFRLLTGRTPYGEYRELPAMLMAHLMRPIPRPTDLAPDLPPAINDIIARALSKSPDDRFETAGALATAAAAALTGQPPTGVSAARGPATNTWTNPTLSYPPTYPPAPAAPGPGFAPPGLPHGPGAPGTEPHLAGPQHFPGTHPVGLSGPPPPQPRRRSRGRLILAAASVLTAVVLAAVVAVRLLGHPAGGLTPYQPQSLTGKFGTIKLEHRPLAIAALGPGDADAVLSLGVQPVVMAQPQATVPSWLQPLVHASSPVLGIADPAAVAPAKPDLIIDTGDIDQPTYNQLATIAPTLTQPTDTPQDWTWQRQITWIATALGRSDTATTLINDTAAQQTKIKSDHPAFTGKSIVAVTYAGTTTTAAAAVSPPTSYLESIGFRYSTHYKRSPSDPPELPFDINDFDFIGRRADVMLLLRTDPAAGGGGYAGLPAKYSSYGGTLVIVDDSATITALDTGGAAATSYLNSALVAKLANQIR